MDWALFGACILCGWTTLSVIGGERQRRARQLAAEAKATAAAAADAAKADQVSPASSSAFHRQAAPAAVRRP